VSDVFGEEAGIHQGVSLDDLTANLQDGGRKFFQVAEEGAEFNS